MIIITSWAGINYFKRRIFLFNCFSIRVNFFYAIPTDIFNALRVFFISIVIVIGPTPPGTGVIDPAISLAASKSTSPLKIATILLGSFALGFSPTLLTPTSMTQAPGLIHSGLTRPGTPAATIRMSARLQWPARSWVRV